MQTKKRAIKAETLAAWQAKGVLELFKTREDGTQEYIVHLLDPRSAATLIVHPERPETFDYEEMPFYVQSELYADVEQYDLRGSDVEDIETADDLEQWLNDNCV